MDKMKIRKLYHFYKDALLEDSVPFWLNHCVDHELGGYMTCLDRQGNVYNTDKSVWFQGRGAWMFSRLYNLVENREEWLEASRLGIQFILDHCFDKDGRMFFHTTREGKPLRKRRYMFSETFAIVACAEYYRASGDRKALDTARNTYDMVMDLYRNPSKSEPKVIPETRVTKGLALPMILLVTTQQLREVDPDPKYDLIAEELVNTVIRDYLKADEQALFETVGPNGERLDSPQGRCINPGHSIEMAWFILHEGMYRKDQPMIDVGLKILDWSMKLGWDDQYGGLLYFVDIEGKPAEQLEWDMKLWWPHTEALYALLLAHHLTGEEKYEAWFDKMHEYSFSHFADKEYGDWYGYLHRDGSVSNTLKGNLFKGPFHLPRALLLCMKLLEEMAGNA